jgi:hypothetical protein
LKNGLIPRNLFMKFDRMKSDEAVV